MRRVSMATQPGNPPELGSLGRRGGEQSGWKAPGEGRGARAGAAGHRPAAVPGPILAQRRQGNVRAPAGGPGRQSHTQRTGGLQPRRYLGCDEKEALIFLGDPEGFMAMLRNPRMECPTWGAVPTARAGMSPNILWPWARYKFLIWEFKASFYIPATWQPLFLLGHSQNYLKQEHQVSTTESSYFQHVSYPHREGCSRQTRHLLKGILNKASRQEP